jgi:hypothetical protein
MSFDMLKTELQSLPADARRKLLAFMVALEDQARDGYAVKLAEKINDQSPDRWLTVDECERKLGLSGEAQ